MCDHMRAIDLYTDSIVMEHAGTGVLCSNYATFQKGNCPHDCSIKGHCAIMGFHSDKSYVKGMIGDRNRFFLDTNADVPYCGLLHRFQNSSIGKSMGSKFPFKPKESKTTNFVSEGLLLF